MRGLKGDLINAYKYLKGRFREDLLAAFQHWKEACKKDWEIRFIGKCSDSTEGNCFKLKEESFRLGIRKKLLSIKRHRNRFSR